MSLSIYRFEHIDNIEHHGGLQLYMHNVMT